MATDLQELALICSPAGEVFSDYERVNRLVKGGMWAAGEIDRLQMALKVARSNLHEIEAGDMSTFEAVDAINIALGEPKNAD